MTNGESHKNNRSTIDDILEEVHSGASETRHDAIDEDVNAILESLGLSAGPRKGNVLSSQNAAPQPSSAAISSPQTAASPVGHGQGTSFALSAAPAAPPAKPAQTGAKLPPPARAAAAPHIVNTAPLAAPVVRSETETLELPTIKAYSAMQAQRIAELQRNAAEEALARAAELERKKNPYAVPGMKPRSSQLSVEVDDRFRAFFGTSVANDGSSRPDLDTAEIEPVEEPARGKQKRAKGSRRKGRIKNAIEKAVQDPDEVFLTDEFDPPIPRDNVQAALSGTDGITDGPQLLDMTGNFDVLGIAAQDDADRDSEPFPSPSPSEEYESMVQNGPADSYFRQSAQTFNAPEAASPNYGSEAADRIISGAQDFTDTFRPAVQASDTFMMNHLDDRAEERYDDAPAPPAFPQRSTDDFRNGYETLDSFGSTSGGFAPLAKSYEDYIPRGAGYEEPPIPSGSTFHELTITVPLNHTTSTLGIDPDKYGVPNSDYEESEDYNHLSDAPAVTRALQNMRLTRILRICITGLIGLFLLYLGVSARSSALPPIALMDATTQPFVFLVCNLALLALAALVCMTTIGAGLVGLFRRPTADTMTTLAVIAAVAQCAAYVVSPSSYDPAKATLFAPAAVLLLCGNAVGKWLHSKAVSDSFTIASAGEDHAAAFVVPNRELTKMVCTGLGEPDPLLLVSRPTELVRGFMRQSFSSHLSDVYGRKLSLIMLMCGVLCGIVGGLRAGDAITGISCAAAALCLAAPLSATLVYAAPALLLQRAAGEAGAVVPGPSAVQNLGRCNTVLLQSGDLFPASSVRLHGIRPFNKQRIDLAILYAASLVYENCDTLRDTFLALIDNKKDMLYKVETPQVETGYGFSGWIEKHEMVLGNRAMMRRHGIEIPSPDFERKFTKNGERSIMYLAVGGRAFSMYVISYNPDPEAQNVLGSLAESGISALIQSDDFNLTAQLVASTYHVSPSLVKVLSQPEREMLAGQTDYLPESEGYMTHRGSCASFIGGLRAAATAAKRERLADTIEMAGVLFTLLVCIVLSFALGLHSLSLAVVLLYQLAWCAITLVPAIFKK